MMLVIYRYAFAYVGGPINGVNAEIAVWSILVYHVLMYTQFRGIFTTINDEIKRGSLETQLNKPYGYLHFKLFEHFGKGLPNLIILSATIVPLLYVLTGGIPTTLDFQSILAAALLVVGGTMVSGALYVLTVLPALWIDDAQPAFWIVDKSIMLFGGGYFPMALLPGAFQTFANSTPFGAPMFATQMFLSDFTERWVFLLGVQVFWIAVLFAAVSVIFARAQHKLSINGG
jgi:ABC-2 type transport system permease protein